MLGKFGENSIIAFNDYNEIFLRFYIGKGYYIILLFLKLKLFNINRVIKWGIYMCSINILNLFLMIYKGFDEVINLKKF